jgi:curved DNA-binding protein CbpA
MKDYYYILGVKNTASADEIKTAYRKLSLKFHPDKNNGDKFFEERFKEIQEAYDILSSSDKRRHFDRVNGYGKTKSQTQDGQNNYTQQDPKENVVPKTESKTSRGRNSKHQGNEILYYVSWLIGAIYSFINNLLKL